jgi:hypothetical protein
VHDWRFIMMTKAIPRNAELLVVVGRQSALKHRGGSRRPYLQVCRILVKWRTGFLIFAADVIRARNTLQAN